MESMEGAIGNWRWPSNDNDVTCRLAQALSDHAVYWVIERRYGEYGDPSPADNLSARGQMCSDLYETLEFLIASLATGEPRLFNDYVQWRLDVLGFRSQQTVELVAVLGLPAYCNRLVQPALYAVGQLWQRNEITVA